MSNSVTIKLAKKFEIKYGLPSNIENSLSKQADLKNVKYRHFKGGLYDVVDIAFNSETELPDTVVYRNSKGQLWVRPLDMWNEETDRWPDGKLRPRFVPADEVTDIYPLT